MGQRGRETRRAGGKRWMRSQRGHKQTIPEKTDNKAERERESIKRRWGNVRRDVDMQRESDRIGLETI